MQLLGADILTSCKYYKSRIFRLLSVIITIALINTSLPVNTYAKSANTCLSPVLQLSSPQLKTETSHIFQAWTDNHNTPVKEIAVQYRPEEIRKVYQEFFSGEAEVDRNLSFLAKELSPEKRLVIISATAYGGGVAEIMHFLIPLMRDYGVRVDWYVLETLDEYNYKDKNGNAMNRFYDVTKKLHNGAQGKELRGEDRLTEEEKEIYRRTTDYNFERLKKVFKNPNNIFFIEDFQPAGLIPKIRDLNEKLDQKARIIFRLHIDTWGIRNNEETKKQFGFLVDDINKADAIVTHIPEFADIPGIKIPAYSMPPSMDPLNDKNRELTSEEIEEISKRIKEVVRVQDKNGIQYVDGRTIDFNGKKVILCVSRADPWKGQLELIERFEKLNRDGKIDKDTILVLVSNFADDDPEGKICFDEMVKKAENNENIYVCTFSKKDNNLNVNFLQRIAKVVAQLSEREGFGLTIAEALWKGTAVLCFDRGGMTEQVVDGYNGYVIKRDSPDYKEQIEHKLVKLLNFSNLERAEMGEYGKLVVAEKFTITSEAIHRMVLALAELDKIRKERVYPVGELAQEFIAKKRHSPPIKLIWERGRIMDTDAVDDKVTAKEFIIQLHQYFKKASKKLSEIDDIEVDLNTALNFINIYIVNGYDKLDYDVRDDNPEGSKYNYVPEEYKCGFCVESGKIYVSAKKLKAALKDASKRNELLEELVEGLKAIVEVYNSSRHLKHPDTRLNRLDLCIKKMRALSGRGAFALINQAI